MCSRQNIFRKGIFQRHRFASRNNCGTGMTLSSLSHSKCNEIGYYWASQIEEEILWTETNYSISMHQFISLFRTSEGNLPFNLICFGSVLFYIPYTNVNQSSSLMNEMNSTKVSEIPLKIISKPSVLQRMRDLILQRYWFVITVFWSNKLNIANSKQKKTHFFTCEFFLFQLSKVSNEVFN